MKYDITNVKVIYFFKYKIKLKIIILFKSIIKFKFN